MKWPRIGTRATTAASSIAAKPNAPGAAGRALMRSLAERSTQELADLLRDRGPHSVIASRPRPCRKGQAGRQRFSAIPRRVTPPPRSSPLASWIRMFSVTRMLLGRLSGPSSYRTGYSRLSASSAYPARVVHPDICG